MWNAATRSIDTVAMDCRANPGDDWHESPSCGRTPSPSYGKTPSPKQIGRQKSPSPTYADWLREQEEKKAQRSVARLPVFGSFVSRSDGDDDERRPKRPRARRAASPVDAHAGLFVFGMDTLRQIFSSVTRELGRGANGVVHEAVSTYHGEAVAVKITEQKMGLHEAEANRRMIGLKRYTENFALVYDTFLSAATIEGTAIVPRDASTDPLVWIVQEKIDIDWMIWMSQNFDMDDNDRRYFKTPFPESMFFELAWLLFVCAKHAKSTFGDMRLRNSCMKTVPYARAYHVNGNVYVFGPEVPMFKMIDVSLVPNPDPARIPGIARDVDMYLALMSERERRIMANIRATPPADEAFDALVSRAGYARASQSDIDTFVARGVEVRHFYA